MIVFYGSLVWFWINTQWISTKDSSFKQKFCLLWVFFFLLLGKSIARFTNWAKQKYTSITRATKAKQQTCSPLGGHQQRFSDHTAPHLKCCSDRISPCNFIEAQVCPALLSTSKGCGGERVKLLYLLLLQCVLLSYLPKQTSKLLQIYF